MEKDNISFDNIYCIIVLYNKDLKDSVTFNCLKDIVNINIIVCDNSTKKYVNEEYTKDLNFTYINMYGNKGLSKAYNSAIKFLNKKSGLLCLFDDDTFVSRNYFDVLLKESQKTDADIFLPVVYDEVGILSPCRIDNLRIKKIKNLKELNNKNITAINSGMAINLNIFDEYKYNEKYFLDYIDHDFLRAMKSKNKKIEIINAKLNQNFSRNDNSNLESSLNRFRIYRKDFKYFYCKNIKSRVFANLSILKRTVYLTLKFKTFKFLINR